MRTRRWYGLDAGLSARMIFIMLVIVAVYAAYVMVLRLVGLSIWAILAIAADSLLVHSLVAGTFFLGALGAVEAPPEKAPQLHGMVEWLSAIMDLPKPRIAVVESNTPNALAIGRTPTSPVLCCTKGLFRCLKDDELEAVIAHELTHIKNRDAMLMTLFMLVPAMLQSLVVFGSHLVQGAAASGAGDAVFDIGDALSGIDINIDLGDSDDLGKVILPILLAILIVCVATFVVWFVTMVILLPALSRYRELAADRGGALLIGAPSVLASALVKVSEAKAKIPSEGLHKIEMANAFLFMPAYGTAVLRLSGTHPSLDKRLEQLRNLQQSMETV